MNRYYFRIEGANVLEVIRANSFLEAKQIAFEDYCPVWNQIQWLEPVHAPVSKTYP
jgi:hypothetical protein